MNKIIEVQFGEKNHREILKEKKTFYSDEEQERTGL